MFFGRYKTLILLTMLLCILGGAHHFFVQPHRTNFEELSEQLTLINKRLVAKQLECASLNKKVYDLEHNPAAIEKVARENLGLCRSNERFYRY